MSIFTLHEFALALDKATTTTEAKRLLSKYLSGFGFRFYAFTYYSQHVKTGSKLVFECVSKALRPWHDYYLEQKFADVDRTLEQIYQFTLPTLWNIKEQLAQAKNGREKRLREESVTFGGDKGLSLPVHGPNGDFATLTLHQFINENTLINYHELQYEWLSAAHVFYHYIRKILTAHDGSKDLVKLLTKRERQCLALTAEAWRVEHIAQELKISTRTVNFHLQNANRKLGVNNKYQAIQKIYHLLK